MDYFDENRAFSNTFFFNEILYRVSGIATFLDGRRQQ